MSHFPRKRKSDVACGILKVAKMARYQVHQRDVGVSGRKGWIMQHIDEQVDDGEKGGENHHPRFQSGQRAVLGNRTSPCVGKRIILCVAGF